MIHISIFSKYNPIQKLFLLLMIFIGFFFIIQIALILIGIVFWGKNAVIDGGMANSPLSYVIFFQMFTQLFVFGGSALFFTSLISPKPFSFLKINHHFDGRFLISSSILIILVIPLAGWLQQVCISAPYPESWQPIIDSLKNQEESGNKLMMRFLNVDGLGWLFFNLLFLAAIPAVCEELLFRGALIGVLKTMIKNKHLLVVVSAIIFSAIHLQFFSFLSRFVLGLVLGYAFVYSKSIIPSMMAHFVNNALSVIAFYFSDRTSMTNAGSIDNNWIILFTTLSAILTIVWMHKYQSRDEQIEV